MTANELTLLAVGDIVLGEEDPDRFFVHAAPVLRSGDVVIAHIESTYTREGMEMPFEVPSAAGDPSRLSAIPAAGFNLATIAGNHAYDQGPNGVRDTMGTLRELGVATAGTGMNLAEARSPATIDKCGLRVAVLSYNAVGPKESWAGPKKAGAAYVNVMTHYEQEYATPGGPGRIYTFVEPDSLEAMERDIEDLRAHCDVLVVAFHKGVGHTRATVASAEKHLTHAAVNAGADVVIGHHAHICKGVEVYRGKPIYHGLGNFVTPGRSLSIDPKENESPERLLWAKRRRQIFGFEPDPSMPNYAFHPESRNTMIARVQLTKDGIVRAGYIPCYIDQQVRPEPLTRDNGGQQVFDYMATISAEAGFKTEFAWNDAGDEVLVSTT
jgi:poly-gamma-glutamate capsule biosynthesis protein CapA/YwtB (metallophosphatase superfamily)